MSHVQRGCCGTSQVMENTPASYPFMMTEVKTYNVHTDENEVIIENPYLSQLPTRFIVGMVQANAYGGDRKLNPLNFQNYDISKAAFYIDNESIAKPPCRLDPAQCKYVDPFLELYSILGKAGEDKDTGISLKEYDGLFLIPFDVTPTSSANMEYLAKKRVVTADWNYISGNLFHTM